MGERASGLIAISYSQIRGWAGDDHARAFAAFRRSCVQIVKRARAGGGKKKHDRDPLVRVCSSALKLRGDITDARARGFFESRFTPYRYRGGAAAGFVTGYFEPELKGSRTRSKRYPVPVYSVPDDLVQLFPDTERAARNHEMTAGRRTRGGVVPYYDRRQIEKGALAGRGLEILYLENWVDAFYMHIQGSGRVALKEGGHLRLSFAAKNGLSYTAIGRLLLERGEISRDEMSMKAVRGWLEDNKRKARALMWKNRSYIFFRVLPDASATGPSGAQGVALSPLRSLAVDTSIYSYGTPIWVNAPDLVVAGSSGFNQLMIAQDTGSAIRGPQRGDIFFGTGRAAGDVAGATRHAAGFTILLPNK